MTTDSGRLSGSREPSPSGLGPSGFDPERVRTFAEGDPAFPEMFDRGREFLRRLSIWYGAEFMKLRELDQQDRLGIARAMCAAIAMEARQGTDPEDGLDGEAATARAEGIAQ